MIPKYPNLPLINERCLNILGLDSHKNLVAQVFIQSWPNTAGGFENGGISGQAFIQQYTTVMWYEPEDVWIVCFDNTPAYVVMDPPEVFFQDLHDGLMECVKGAKERYY